MTSKEMQAVLSKHGIDHNEIDLEDLDESFEKRTVLPIEVSRAVRLFEATRRTVTGHVARNVRDYQNGREARLRADLSRAQSEHEMNQSPFGRIAFTQAGELVEL